MSEILSGLSGRKYTIAAHIKSGGEGGVYETDIPEVAAKLYDTSKINVEARMSEMEAKIRYMVAHPIPTRVADGTVLVTWPQDVLYRNGKFVGYIMPKISGAKPIYILNRGGKSAETVIPGYNWKTAISVAANLAYVVSYLHQRNVVIGDMNSDNLMVYSNGQVAVIDTDSFEIRDDSSHVHYKCRVGTEEFLPPELQGYNLERANVCFTKHTDEFALAIHIFQLLMNNMHPFNARVIRDYKQSLPENNRNYNIAVGNCPFVRKIPGCDVPMGAPNMSDLLPDYLILDFAKTFDYQLDQSASDYMAEARRLAQNRTPASDWYMHLKQLRNGAQFVLCPAGKHFYLAYKGKCAMCEAGISVQNFASASDSAPVPEFVPEPGLKKPKNPKKPKKPMTHEKKTKIALALPAIAIFIIGLAFAIEYSGYYSSVGYAVNDIVWDAERGGMTYYAQHRLEEDYFSRLFGLSYMAFGMIYMFCMLRSKASAQKTVRKWPAVLFMAAGVAIPFITLLFVANVYESSTFGTWMLFLGIVSYVMGVFLFPFNDILEAAKEKDIQERVGKNG